MTSRRRSHRSHVSYIDASREYYAAAGYETPYEWATNDDVPFTTLPKPLASCRVGVVVTSYLPASERPTFVSRPDHAYAVTHDHADRLENQELQWDKDETHTDDTETFLPLQRLAETVAAGRLGSLSPRFYGVPTQYSHRKTSKRDAPEIEEAMRADGVDVVLLVPL